MKTINQKYQTNGPLLVGPVVPPGTITTGERLGVIPDNQSKFVALNKTWRVRSHDDGWFVDGSRHRSQIWESGAGLIGLTVIGFPLLKKCASEKEWLVPKQIGDGEGNFYCLWNEENLTRLTRLVGLQRRNKPRIGFGGPIGQRKPKDAN